MESKGLEFNLNGNILFADGRLTIKGEVKTIFDVLIEKIEKDIQVNQLSLVKDNLDIYLKFGKESKWGDWKTNRINHADRLIKIREELNGSKIIDLIENGHSRQVLKIDEVLDKMNELIMNLEYDYFKYSDLSTIDVNTRFLQYIPFNNKSSLLRSSFKVRDNIIDDLELLFIKVKGIIINLSNTNNTSSEYKYRGIGKTTVLLKLCERNNATLIVPNHQSKKYADNLLKQLGFHVQVSYINSGSNLNFDKFYIDEMVSESIVNFLLDNNKKCLGGFANHESFK